MKLILFSVESLYKSFLAKNLSYKNIKIKRINYSAVIFIICHQAICCFCYV